MLSHNPRSRPEQRLVSRTQVPRPFMGRREWVSVLMIVFALAVVVLAFTPDSGSGDEENPGNPISQLEMPYPNMLALEASIQASEIEAFADRINEYLGRSDRVFGQPLPILIGWANEQLRRDQARLPIPMRVAISDVAQASNDPYFNIPSGSRVAMSGQLIEKHPFTVLDEQGEVAQQWQRLLVEAGPRVFFQVLAREQAADLPYGAEINLVGRYLGVVATPIARTEDQEEAPAGRDTLLLPTMAAFEGLEVTAQADRGRQLTSLLRLGAEDQAGGGPFRIDNTVFDDVDDMGLRLERRPYYYLLGLVLRDPTTPGAYDGLIDAVDHEEQLHFHSHEYRGQPVSVRGQVLRAWEDWDVSQDQPFGVVRVIRMWIWAYVPERKQVLVDGEMRTLTSSQLGVFEIAAMVNDNRPLPEPRDTIYATGRFLKVQRYRTSDNFVFNRGSLADADRALSDSAYFKFIVTNGFESTPPREEVSTLILKVGFLVVFVSLLFFILYLIDRDRGRMDDYKRPIRKLRRSRRALYKSQAAQQKPLSEGESAAAAETENLIDDGGDAPQLEPEENEVDGANHDGDPRP